MKRQSICGVGRSFFLFLSFEPLNCPKVSFYNIIQVTDFTLVGNSLFVSLRRKYKTEYRVLCLLNERFFERREGMCCCVVVVRGVPPILTKGNRAHKLLVYCNISTGFS
jgi:hypothetical protein